VSTFEKWAIWVSSVLVTVSGVVYFGMKYLLPVPDGFSIVRHPLQPLILKLHIITAPLLLFAIGAVAIRHIWRHLMSGTSQGKYSGWSAALTTVPMVFSGYLLQVVSSETWLRGLAIAHIVAGTIYGGGLLLHQVMVRQGKTGAERITSKRAGPRRHPRRTTTRRIPR
jgi:uncharacterized membrane protein